jgi:hypothetical protein
MNIDEFKNFPIDKQLEIVVSQGKLKYVKKLLKTYKFNDNVLKTILIRLKIYIKNNQNLENINDYISIRRLFIELLEPVLFGQF